MKSNPCELTKELIEKNSLIKQNFAHFFQSSECYFCETIFFDREKTLPIMKRRLENHKSEEPQGLREVIDNISKHDEREVAVVDIYYKEKPNVKYQVFTNKRYDALFGALYYESDKVVMIPRTELM